MNRPPGPRILTLRCLGTGPAVRRAPLWGAGLLTVGLSVSAPTQAETPLLYQQIAVKHQLSAEALYRRALQRSGRQSPYASAPVPWPWTVRRCRGERCETVYPENRAAMAEVLAAGRAAHWTLYVGPLGWRWEDHSRLSLRTVTSPRITINEAARQWAQETLAPSKTPETGGSSLRTLNRSRPLLPEGVSPRERTARWSSLIERVAREEGLHPALIHAMVHVESSYRPEARSPQGAVGLMQLMPETAERFGLPRDQRHQPEPNLRTGMRYLKWLMRAFDQDLVLVLAAYNAGEGAVLKYGRRIPPYPETQHYVRQITHRLAQYSTPSGVPDS